MNIAVCSAYTLFFNYEREGIYIVTCEAIRLLAEQGHRVTAYTQVATNGRSDHPNMRYKEIDRDSQDIRADDDEDVLIIHSCSWADKIFSPYAPAVWSIMANWNGPVIYLQTDPQWGLDYDPERIDTHLSKHYASVADTLTAQQVVDGVDKITVVTNAQNTSKASKTYARNGYPYQSKKSPYPVEMHFINLCEIVTTRLDILTPQSAAHHSVYIGHKRSRTRCFRRLFEEPDVPVVVYGKGWNTDKFDIDYRGVCSHTDLQQTYNDAWYTVSIFDTRQHGTSSITNRLYEAIYSGCLTFIDSKMFSDPAHCPLPDKFLVEDADDIHERLLEFQGRYLELATEQQECMVALTDVPDKLSQFEQVLRRNRR